MIKKVAGTVIGVGLLATIGIAGFIAITAWVLKEGIKKVMHRS